MIIPLINQKKLLSLTSQEEARRIADLLKQHGIEYYEKTERSAGSNVMSRYVDFRTATKTTGYGGIPTVISAVMSIHSM